MVVCIASNTFNNHSSSGFSVTNNAIMPSRTERIVHGAGPATTELGNTSPHSVSIPFKEVLVAITMHSLSGSFEPSMNDGNWANQNPEEHGKALGPTHQVVRCLRLDQRHRW